MGVLALPVLRDHRVVLAEPAHLGLPAPLATPVVLLVLPVILVLRAHPVIPARVVLLAHLALPATPVVLRGPQAVPVLQVHLGLRCQQIHLRSTTWTVTTSAKR
jgi:hypothetical protein